MNKTAVIVAGGSGQRMGTSLPKQFLLLHNKPVLWYTLNQFLKSYEDLQVILVAPESHMDKLPELVDSTYDPKRIRVTTGGSTRFHSVQRGVQLVTSPCIVFIHDGVRCLVSEALIKKCYEQAMRLGNAIPATSATDTIRIETDNGNQQVDRNRVRLIQTPQTFHSEIILPAFKQQYQASFTDEASVVENMGVKINLIEGESSNIKITRPVDLAIAEYILRYASTESK